MKTVAGIDMGTQSMKVVLYDFETKKIVASATHAIDIIAENDGTREQKVEWYDEALKDCFAQLSTDNKKTIVAMGVSGHQHGFVPLSSDGSSLYNVKLWNDTSTTQECALLTEALGGEDAVIAEVCNVMLPGFTAPKIYWLKRNKPDAFAKLHYIMLPHDYLNFKLTGEYTMEAGDASGTALFNANTKKWSIKACDAIDSRVKDLLPTIIDAAAPCGYLTAEMATLLGVPEGIPVSCGGGDNMMSAIGTGTVQDGVVAVSMGTSGTLYAFSGKPLADPKNGLSGFCSSSGGWLPLLCTMNCTVATEQLRALFELGVREFDDEAAKAPVGAEGVVILPFFNGERTPNLPNGKASITGLTAANANRANISRAALESAVFALLGGLEAFSNLGFVTKEIRLTGGGAKSPLWRQIVADVFNVPVKIPLNSEAAAFGSALQALWCYNNARSDASVKEKNIEEICIEHVLLDGATIEPNTQNVTAYKDAYKVYQENLKAVAPMYK